MMRKISKILSVCLVAIMFLTIVGCSKCDGEKDPSVSLQLSATELQTLIGDQNQLTVKNYGVNPEDVTWTSENSSVASVDENGLVESISVGSTKITAKCGKYKTTCDISVSLGNKLPQLVIENEREKYNIGSNQGSFPFELYVLFNGKKFYDAEITCVSANTDVATFSTDAQGTLNILGEGETAVSFSAKWRGMDYEDVPSLFKLVQVKVVEEVYFYINGSQYDVLNLSTIDEFEGQTYVNEMDFVLSVSVSGETSSTVSYTLPEDILAIEGNKIRAIKYGTGNIVLTYTDTANNEYQSTVPVSVIRPEATYQKHISYFSTFTGMFKDVDNGYADTTLAKKLFGSDDVEISVTYDGQALTAENGKILGMPDDYRGAYDAMIRVETEKVVYNVNLTAYCIVVQSAEDLKLFALKFLRNDNPLTAGEDETTVTRIDGYCELINDIDASGIKIPHEIFGVTYDYVNSAGQKVKESIKSSRYNMTVQKNEHGEYSSKDGLKAFGLTGRFNGNGYTIENLDTSVEAGKVGGGLFGYAFGNAIIENVGFTNMNISNSSGLCYESFIPVPRPSGKDVLGLRTDNTYFHDIFIELSKDTINPKGALMYKSSSTMGLLRVENIILDATEVALNANTTGGVLTNEGSMLCAQNISTRFSSKDVYVVTDEYPAYFNANATVYGENEADGKALDGQTSGKDTWTVVFQGKVYSSKFMRYDSFEQMKNADNDYSSFSSPSWVISGYPLFKTSAGVFPSYAGEIVLDSTIKVNSSINGKKLTLTTFTGEDVTIDGYEYDDNQLKIDTDGVIKLATEVLDRQEYQLKVRYTYKEKAQEMTLKVLAYPSIVEIDTKIRMSAHDGIIDVAKYVEQPKQIVSVTQHLDSGNVTLSVNNDVISGARVVIKSDYSGVETSEFTIETLDMTYKFTCVEVYSHIITEADDLQVLIHTANTARITGYYVLDNNINALNYQHKHASTVFSSNTFDTKHAFQGVFDGQGYAIYNFRPGIGGLLGSVYSDTEENGGRTVIKDVAFINMLSTKSVNDKDNPFTVFGKFIQSSKNGIKTEVKNVHVEIVKTYLSDYNPTSNYKGLFYANRSEWAETFKFTNIYVKIADEEYNDTLSLAHGSILSSDNVGTWSGLENRSKRFDNVITVTKMNPCAYRQYVGGGLTQTFDTTHMYVYYSCNDIGKQGMRFNWMEESAQYGHSPVADCSDDTTKGSYVYNNVYRYDSVDQVEQTQVQKLIDSGLWKLVDGKLAWKKAPVQIEITDEGMNFHPDWLKNN